MKIETYEAHVYHRQASSEQQAYSELDTLLFYEILKRGDSSISSKEFLGGNGELQMKSFLYQEWARIAATNLTKKSESIAKITGEEQT